MTFRAIGKELRKLKRDGTLATLAAVARYPATLRKRAAYRRMLAQDDRKRKFGAIYEGGLWHSRESGSGQGSEAQYTQNLRQWLPGVIKAHGIQSIVDAPCGDFNWMRLMMPALEVDYLGVDIVDFVISTNTETYSNDRVKFAVADICKDPLPDCDLLIVRDCLFHLSNSDIDLVLQNIAGVNYRFLLTTTHTANGGFENSDIVSGDFRLIDLFESPYGFDRTSVIDRVDDFPPGYAIEREMVLIPKDAVPTSLG